MKLDWVRYIFCTYMDHPVLRYMYSIGKFGHKTIRFFANNDEINIQTNYTIFILFTQLTLCVKNQSKTPHHLRARGDNNNKIINLIIMQMNYII
jgi:hypothetical protein